MSPYTLASVLDLLREGQLLGPDALGALEDLQHRYRGGPSELVRLVRDQGALPVGRACDYVRQAALGLQHALERGLVHRDVKPSNLLLTSSANVVKVLDLGLASLAGAVPAAAVSGGTPDYMAPEQAFK